MGPSFALQGPIIFTVKELLPDVILDFYTGSRISNPDVPYAGESTRTPTGSLLSGMKRFSKFLQKIKNTGSD